MIELDAPVRDALDRLAPAELQRDDWEDVIARVTDDQVSTVPSPLRKRRASTRTGRRPARAAVPLLLAAVVAVAIALSVTAPWKGGPSVIEKASAAISTASPTQVIYEKATIAPFLRTCAHGAKPGEPCLKLQTVRIELWVEGGGGTRSFRAITRQSLPKGFTGPVWTAAAPFGNALATHTGRVSVTEVGGLLGPTHVKEAFVYQRYSNILIRFTQAPTAISSDSFDPVALIRHALAGGNARATGRTRINGRRVRIFQVRMRDNDGDEGTATYYADDTTYAPVRIVYHHSDFLQFPYTPVFDSSNPFSISVDFSTFYRAPATTAARALTNIRVQHKTATIVCGQEFGLPDC